MLRKAMKFQDIDFEDFIMNEKKINIENFR